MSTLSRELRRVLENTVVEARSIAEGGAKAGLESLAVHKPDPYKTTSLDERDLRLQLRARGHQLGDTRGRQGEQSLSHLAQACAYEHWHRMLFARFLAENGFLLDPHYQLALSMDDVQERARELGRDWLDVASEFAQRMLLDVFRPGDPVLEVIMPPEKRQQLETKLSQLPKDVFLADDSLGWVYQFWQKEEKDRINHSETKIGADQLAAVTQLFTEDYMVLFLLHNTLGAWWSARRGPAALQDYEWSYLRLNADGVPAAGVFEGWPKHARDLRILDPCMGSGHFLTFALPIIARMRMVEENLPLRDAIYAALRDNLFGLELDERCSQIAAFNLALTAWRLTGEQFAVPKLNLASSGLGINATEAEWTKLADSDPHARATMQKLYGLFQKAPVLGSLIDPTHVGDLITAQFGEVKPLLERALGQEGLGEEQKELAIAAEGLLAAARILANKFTLIATNVPYLGRGKQDADLTSHCERHHADARADIATCFADRILCWCGPGGTAALVTPQNWLFLSSYKKLRERFLRSYRWDFVFRLGPRAFETITGEVVNVALLGLTQERPSADSCFIGCDVSSAQPLAGKIEALKSTKVVTQSQLSLLRTPDARIVLDHMPDDLAPLGSFAESYQGIRTGDRDRFVFSFWEISDFEHCWEPLRSSATSRSACDGISEAIRWESGKGQLHQYARETREKLHDMHESGNLAWGKEGIAINHMNDLRAYRYWGEKFDGSVNVIVPKEPDLLPAIWSFCSEADYERRVRKLDQKMYVTNGTLVKVPFDRAHWQEIAARQYPAGLPSPHSASETQWLFDGSPKCSDHPLQVGVARLLGYRWPRQTGSRFPACPDLEPDGLEMHAAPDGIICLASISGQEPGHARLRALLAHAFGREWSAQCLTELVGDAETLENWLLKRFFLEHCEIFHARPFIWQVWDGRRDGFNALVNYHKLAAPDGGGRRTLERLIYTYLGDWIRIQESQIGKVDGADARLIAAQHLRQQLEAILKGEPPFDIFVRWKPIHQQPIGWEPDLNDGVRLNMRPWLEARPYKPSRRDACILRETPIKLPLGKDRGKEPPRDPEDFPWFNGSTDRTNDVHLTIEEKQAARDRKARK